MLAKSYVCWFEIPNMVNIPNNRKTRAIGKKYAAMKVNAKSKLPSCTNPDRCGMMKAYTAKNGGKEGFDQYAKKLHVEIAPQVDQFELPDYDGKRVKYADIRGDVTLLAFWFPT